MKHAILIVFFWVVFISFSIFLVIILGTYLADTFKGSKFDKWWNKHIITQIPEDYED